MTVDEMAQLYYLRKEVVINRQQLEALNKLRGVLPPACKDAIADCTRLISQRQRRCTRQLNRLEEYVANIEDDFVQQVFILRYVRGLTWLKIAKSTDYLYSDEYLKKMCYRYMEKADGKGRKNRAF